MDLCTMYSCSFKTIRLYQYDPICVDVYIYCIYPTLSYPILSYPTLPYPTLPYPTLPYPTLPYPTLPYPILSYPILSYPILSYPILSYPIYPIYVILFLSNLITISSNLILSRYLYMHFDAQVC